MTIKEGNMEDKVKTIIGGQITKIKFKTQEDLYDFERKAGFNHGCNPCFVIDESIEVSEQKPFKVIFDNEE
jgi:hypothetical protein